MLTCEAPGKWARYGQHWARGAGKPAEALKVALGSRMGTALVSVVIASRGRPKALAETLRALVGQAVPASDFEIIVVDDGSVPPLCLRELESGVRLRVLRLDGRGRSAARNAGARAAVGDTLVFVDDDITVGPEFLDTHLFGQGEWPGVLAVGSISLPDKTLGRPFGHFRRRLERPRIPRRRGRTDARNFCTAANMSMGRRQFLELGGFDEDLVSAEDQDLALRHSAAGGTIVFLPEAVGIHRDEAMDVRSYCRRVEWGSRHMVAFCRKHPAWPDNIAREQVNGPVRLGREPVGQSARKMVKRLAECQPILELLFGAAAVLERVAPRSPLLERMYRMLLGVHIYRGYRHGASRWITRKAAVASDASPKGG